MTEKQGGSDVRANVTRAEAAGDGWWELTGHKWFCSYPPCELFLVLAQAPGGLSCFVLERGPGMEFQRLKDKLGTRSLPSSEVEFRGAAARMLGEEGRGVATIIEMVTHTRLDCVIGSAAGMRRGVAEAVWHARHRSAFGARLSEQPLMRNVLADLALESEAATATALRLARSYDEGDGTLPPLRHRGPEVLDLQARHPARRRGARVPGRQRLRRGVPDAAAAARLAAERDLGGLGQRDEPRRAARDGARARGPAGVPGRVRAARAGPTRGSTPISTRCPARSRAVGRRRRSGSRGAPSRTSRSPSRRRCSLRTAPPAVADAFCAGRLGEARGRAYGTLPAGVDAERDPRRGRMARLEAASGRPLVDSRADDPARPARRGSGRPADHRPGLRQPRGGARLRVLLRARLHPRRPRLRPRRGGARRGRRWSSRGRSGSACRRCVVEDVRSAMALAAARFYGDPTARLPVVGITGTNGKTTTAFLVRSAARGRRPPLRPARARSSR